MSSQPQCRFFLRGHCPFGRNCADRHEAPYNPFASGLTGGGISSTLSVNPYIQGGGTNSNLQNQNLGVAASNSSYFNITPPQVTASPFHTSAQTLGANNSTHIKNAFASSFGGQNTSFFGTRSTTPFGGISNAAATNNAANSNAPISSSPFGNNPLGSGPFGQAQPLSPFGTIANQSTPYTASPFGSSSGGVQAQNGNVMTTSPFGIAPSASSLSSSFVPSAPSMTTVMNEIQEDLVMVDSTADEELGSAVVAERATGTEAVGTEAEGTEAEGTEAVGTEAEGTEAVGTEAVGSEATKVAVVSGVAEKTEAAEVRKQCESGLAANGASLLLREMSLEMVEALVVSDEAIARSAAYCRGLYERNDFEAGQIPEIPPGQC